MTCQTFGQFLKQIPSSQEYLTLNFAPASAPQRQERWRNYGLSADFLGEYFSMFFPGDELTAEGGNRQEMAKAAISYVANELIENAIKYNDETASLPVSITLSLYNQEIIFQICNYVGAAIAQQYRQFVEDILALDLADAYAQQLEKTASGDTGGSGLGLLTIMNDYGGVCGWAFEALDDQPFWRVNVMVHLAV
jgi:hypothetical protein